MTLSAVLCVRVHSQYLGSKLFCHHVQQSLRPVVYTTLKLTSGYICDVRYWNWFQLRAFFLLNCVVLLFKQGQASHPPLRVWNKMKLSKRHAVAPPATTVLVTCSESYSARACTSRCLNLRPSPCNSRFFFSFWYENSDAALCMTATIRERKCEATNEGVWFAQ